MKIIKEEDLKSVVDTLQHELEIVQMENRHFGYINAEAEGYLHALDDIIKRIEKLNLIVEIKERKTRKKKETQQLSLFV